MNALNYLRSLEPLGIDFGLARMRNAMRALGNPQNRVPTIHVAGTNGKGSVAAMMESALRAHGYRTGLYTSPHLQTIHERFQINRQPIDKDEFQECVDEVKNKAPHTLTHFEFLTAVAFLWFARKKVDLAIIETGLGGRLDATNVIAKPLVSVITTIDFDHTEFLGSSLEEIAAEKAGIIKSNVPIVTGAFGVARRVIKEKALNKTALFKQVLTPVRWKLNLQGSHQKFNAAVALEAIRMIPFDFNRTKVKKAIMSASWPGRFEMIKKAGTEIILDGAHNPAASAALVKTLREKGIKNIDLLFGVLKDKDYDRIIDILSPIARRVAVVPVSSSRSARPGFIAAHPAWKGKAQPAGSISEGLQRLSSPILVTGSLYLVGSVRSHVGVAL